MKSYLMFNCFLTKVRDYSLIIFAATIFLSISFSKSFSNEDVFVIDEIEVVGSIDVNFSRNKFINKAFRDSYKILMSKILLSSDFKRRSNESLVKIKSLINSFQILEESYKNNEYKATLKIFYNEKKVKNYLSEKNISFSQPKRINAIFYPALFIDDEFQDFNENYFFKNWNDVKISNELINFVLPIEDIDDIYQIKEIKNKIEDLDINSIVKKYNIENYVFAFMQNENKKLNIYLKTNFNNNQISKNVSFEIRDINDLDKLEQILKDLKTQVTDIWKKENVINLSTPLTLRIKLLDADIDNLNNLKNVFYKINIIDNFSLDEFNINSAFFKIYYYGNPKKLTTELSKYGYKLKNDQGRWIINNE